MNKLLDVRSCQFGFKQALLLPFNFSLYPGEVVALLGENGVGKSTFLRLCVGYEKIISGGIFYGKENRETLSVKDLFQKVSLVRSNLSIPDRILVRDFVMLGMQKKNFELLEKVMKETNIQNFLDRTLISLSDGERSRVLLAEALIRNTSLLLLDEPTAFLDVPRSIDLFKLLKSIAVNENKGILISTHQVEHALKYADRLLVFLRNGQVVSGLVEDVLKSGALSWAELD